MRILMSVEIAKTDPAMDADTLAQKVKDATGAEYVSVTLMQPPVTGTAGEDPNVAPAMADPPA